MTDEKIEQRNLMTVYLYSLLLNGRSQTLSAEPNFFVEMTSIEVQEETEVSSRYHF
jgi:hypothetical protein